MPYKLYAMTNNANGTNSKIALSEEVIIFYIHTLLCEIMTNKFILAKLFYAILTVCFALQAHASGQEDNIFFVENVNVYAESDTLDNAKREAMNAGTYKAFRTLLERLLPMENYWKIDNIEQSKAFDSMKSVNTTFERMTSSSYRATVDFMFDEKRIKGLLNRMGIYYIDSYSPQTLLIPILFDGKRYDIWENESWSEAWGEMPIKFGLMRLNYTIGDLSDTELVDPAKIFTSKFSDNSAVMKHYQSEEMILVLAKQEKSKLNVSVRFLTSTSDKTKQMYFAIKSNINEQEFYKEVATEILQAADSFYKRYDDLAD